MEQKTEIVLRMSKDAIKATQEYARENKTGFDTAVSELILKGSQYINFVKTHAKRIIELSNDGSLEPPNCCLFCDGMTTTYGHDEHDDDCIVLLADKYLPTKENL